MDTNDKSNDGRVSVTWVIILSILCFFLIIDKFSTSEYSYNNYTDENDYEETIKELNNKISDYEDELQSLYEDLSYYKNMVDELENDIDDLTTDDNFYYGELTDTSEE